MGLLIWILQPHHKLGAGKGMTPWALLPWHLTHQSGSWHRTLLEDNICYLCFLMPQSDWQKSEDVGLKRGGGRRRELSVTCACGKRAHFTEQQASISGSVVQQTVSGKALMLSHSEYREVWTVTQGLPVLLSPVYKIILTCVLAIQIFSDTGCFFL